MEAFGKIAPHLANPLVLVGFVLLLFFGIHRTLIKSGILRPVSAAQSGTIVRILLRYGFVVAVLLIVAGFGLAAWQAHLAAGPRVDVNAIVETLTRRHQAELDAARGDTEAAEAIFRQTLERNEATGRSAYKDAAAAARHLGALASLESADRALAAYRKATDLDPENAQGWRGLGDAAVTAGNLAEAERAFRSYLVLSSKAGDEREQAAAHSLIGGVLVAQGSLSEALSSYRASHAIFERLAAADPRNAGWQRDLSVSHERIGDLSEALGYLRAAVDAYERSLPIAQALADRFPDHRQFQSDIAITRRRLSMLRAALE